MTCKKCKIEFEEKDSIGDEFDLCQDCWELDCDEAWWEMVRNLPELGFNKNNK